jgi:hypothetical protein
MRSSSCVLRRIAFFVFAFCVLKSSTALAACTSPAGNEGDIIYSSINHVMAYCNSSSWIGMGTNSGVTFGTLTTNDFCTATSGTAIQCTTATTGSGNVVLATSPTLTSPSMTSPTVSSGGLTITAGGLTVNAGGASITGTVSGTTFSGSGASLTGIGTSNLTAVTGTPSATTFLAGNGQWTSLTTGALPSLTANDIWVGNASNAATAVALSGDCTLTYASGINCTKTNGSLFGSLATLSAAPAGTLTGATLASNVVSSSLTGVGIITSGTWNGNGIDIAHGGTNSNSQTTNGVNYFNGTSITSGTGFVYTGSGYVGIGSSSPINALDIGTTQGVHIASGTPANTSNALYNVSGTLTWNGTALDNSGTSIGTSRITGIVQPANGGTGINNGTNTITVGGNLTTAGAASLPTIAQGDIWYGSASGTISALAKNTTATTYLSNGGASNNPAWAQVNLGNGVTGNLPNANLATQTANTVLGAVTATTPSGLTMPSCSTATSALTWTSGTGFGCNSISASMTYPGAGIANSTGSAWGTSYTTTGSGTVVALAAGPTFTGTVTAAAITASGIVTHSAAGAASASAATFTGAPYTGGTGTTTYPLVYINDGTGPTTFSTNGTELGFNTPSGFTGNFLDAHVNGGSSVFSVNYQGNGLFAGTLGVTGHVTLEGVTSTGATGTGNLVFSASPTFTGTITAAAETLSGTLTTNVTGSTQCLHVNTSGVVSGTGSDCGSGSGSGTVTASTAAGQVAYYQSNASTTVVGTSTITITGGQVGVGSSTPVNTLDVAGTIHASSSLLAQNIDIAGTQLFTPYWPYETISNNSNLRLATTGGVYFHTGSNATTSTPNAYIDGSGNGSFNGNITAYGSVYSAGFYQNSDRQLKDNIKPIAGLDLVNKLNGVTFNWKKDGKLSAGVIAQDVEKVLPEAVHTDDKGMKSVNYDALIAPLIEGEKELKVATDNLKAANEDLKRQVSSQADDIRLLKEQLQSLKHASPP